MSDLEEQLSRWRGAGLLMPAQADAIREYEKLRARPAEPAAPAAPPPPAPTPRLTANLESERPSSRGLPASVKSASRRVPPLDGRLLGGILAALALLAMVGAVFALATDVVVAPTHHLNTDLEDVAHGVAAALGLTGGLRMAGGRADGRVLVLGSLGLNLAATLLLSASRLAEATTFLPVIAWVVLAGLTWYARFPAGAVATRSQVG